MANRIMKCGQFKDMMSFAQPAPNQFLYIILFIMILSEYSSPR